MTPTRSFLRFSVAWNYWKKPSNVPDVQTGEGGQEDATEEGEGHGEQQGEAPVRPHTDLLKADHAVEPHLVNAARGGGLSQHVTHLHLQVGNVSIQGPKVIKLMFDTVFIS